MTTENASNPETFGCGFCGGIHDLTREIEVIREEQRCSTCLIQRRFKLGPPHALEVVRQLEARGYIFIDEGVCGLTEKLLLSGNGGSSTAPGASYLICPECKGTQFHHSRCRTRPPLSSSFSGAVTGQEPWDRRKVQDIWRLSDGDKYQAIADAHNSSLAIVEQRLELANNLVRGHIGAWNDLALLLGVKCWPIQQPRFVSEAVAALLQRAQEAERKLNSPELLSFRDAVVLEAAHQRERWGSEHDAGKEPMDWFWLVGYLAGKALDAHLHGDTEKALHHTISTAAALNNWHAAILGANNEMRPGTLQPSLEAEEQRLKKRVE